MARPGNRSLTRTQTARSETLPFRSRTRISFGWERVKRIIVNLPAMVTVSTNRRTAGRSLPTWGFAILRRFLESSLTRKIQTWSMSRSWAIFLDQTRNAGFTRPLTAGGRGTISNSLTKNPDLPILRWTRLTTRRCTLPRINGAGPHGDLTVVARAAESGRLRTLAKHGGSWRVEVGPLDCSGASVSMSRGQTRTSSMRKWKLAQAQVQAARSRWLAVAPRI